MLAERARYPIALLAAALLVGPIAILLSARVEDLRDRAMAPEPDGITLTPVALEPLPDMRERLPLRTPNGARLAARQELNLEFATSGRTVDLAGGIIAVGGCRFTAARGTRVENNALVRFVRAADCAPETVAAAPAAVSLTMWVPGHEPLVVWTSQSSKLAPDSDALFVEGTARQPAPAVLGRFVDFRGPSPVRRVHLLNYLWHLSGSLRWIGFALGAAGLLVVAGTLAAQQAVERERHATLFAAFAAGAVTLALAILYVVIVPPFEAPDEPDHFLAFADLTQRPDLTREAADWARLGHLQRIKFHIRDRFRPVDVGRPFPEPWDAEIFAMPIGGRSRTTEILWRGVGRLTRGLHAPGTLLALRLTNAAVLAIAVGTGVALVAAHGAGAGAVVVSFAFLLIPTLPFFGTHVSEFAMLTSTYVVTACVLASLVVDGARSHRLGLPLGVAIALLFAGGRSAIPIGTVVAVALAGRTLLATRDSHGASERWRRALIFWGGAALGAALIVPASTAEYSKGLWPGDAGNLPVWFKAAAEAVRERAWLLSACLPLGILLEIGAAAAVRRAGRWLRRPRRAVLLAIAWGSIAVVAGIAIASLFRTMPAVQSFLPQARPPLREYLRVTMGSVLTIGRLRQPDLLLSTSFWGGFGWVDAVLPEPLVTILVVTSVVMALWLALAIARANDGRRAVWIGLLAAAWAAAIVLNTVATYYLYRPMHGRYLLGVYVTGLAVAWTAPVVTRLQHGATPALPRGALLLGLTMIATLHAFALSVILRRYF